MQYQYVIEKDKESGIVHVIARFANGVSKLYKDGKWKVNGFLISLLHDGRLENITEAEANKLILEKNSEQLQAA